MLSREWYQYFVAVGTNADIGLQIEQFQIAPVQADVSARVAELERAVDDLRKGSAVL